MSTIASQSQSLAAARVINRNHELLSRTLSRLSSGSKESTVGAAATAKFDAQSQRVKAAVINAQNTVSHVQAADGLLEGMSRLVTRMGELGVLAQDGTKNAEDRANYATEHRSLQAQLRETIGGSVVEIGGKADVTNPFGRFNGRVLFGGGSFSVTIGEGESVQIPTANLRGGSVGALIQQDATGAFTSAVTDAGLPAMLASATDELAKVRTDLGAVQSRLELATATMQVRSGNLSAAISRIQDVDVATESTRLAKFNILAQTGNAMLAQANQTPKSVLKLMPN